MRIFSNSLSPFASVSVKPTLSINSIKKSVIY